jgi:HK97 family phage portal protein
MQATGLTSADGFAYDGPGLHPLAPYLSDMVAYDQIYERQLWPNVAVNKLTGLQVYLPGKVYKRRRVGREDARTSPFGRLMAKPSTSTNPYVFWGWFLSMYHIHGRAFALKGRAAPTGPTVELHLVHPSRMRYGPPGGGWQRPPAGGVETGGNRWWRTVAPGQERQVSRADFIYLPRFSPRSPMDGMSPFEPLRSTLETEANARKATSVMFGRGGHHGLILKYGKKFKGDGNSVVAQRLADQYDRRHGSVENWARPLVLEDGMDAMPITMSNRDLQYIDIRHLDREEVAAEFDIPPPVIHILDRATYSNITEQNQMVYRLTMQSHISGFEAMVEFDLRDGSFGLGNRPDFPDNLYFEYLLEGVLRGTFEARMAAYATLIQNGIMTPAEVRERENLPFAPGSDVLFINGAVVPIQQQATATDDGGTPSRALLPASARASVLGRLSRPTSLDAVDVDRLVDGLDVDAAAAVRGAVDIARFGKLGVPELRQLVKTMGV